MTGVQTCALPILRANDHRNQHLQHAWNKYGEDAFEFANVTQDYVDAMVYQANVRMHRGAHPLAKRVVCINTGEVFDCAADAAHAFHVDCSSLVKVCKGKLKSCGKDAAGTPLGWRYLDQAS